MVMVTFQHVLRATSSTIFVLEISSFEPVGPIEYLWYVLYQWYPVGPADSASESSSGT